MSHGVVRTDLLAGTDVGYDLVSVQYMGSGSTATAIDNGCFVKLSSAAYDSQREVWKGVTPSATDSVEDLALIASEEMGYDEVNNKNLSDFENAAGAICRGYRPVGIYSATADAFTIADGVTPAAGYVVELNGTVKPAIVATATAGKTKLGDLIAVETTSRYTYYVVRFTPNAGVTPAAE